MAESTPTGPISRVQDNQSVPALPVAAGYLAFGRTSGGIARPIEVDNNGAVVTTGSLTPSSVLTELPLEIATSGNNTIIAAPGVGNRIIIYHINYLTRGAVNVRLLSGTNDLSGLYTWQNAQGGGFAFDGSSVGGLPLNENEAFVINLSTAVGIDGFILYSIAGIAPSPPSGSQDLASVLAVGNITDGTDIELSAGDELTSAAVGATANGNTTTIRGGPGGSSSGNGGAVALIGGTPVEGDGGNVTLTGANGVGTNQDGGDVILAAGSATGSGAPGDITFAARGSGAIPFNESGNTTLSGFTATSIVGALNELNAGGGGAEIGFVGSVFPVGDVSFTVQSPVTFGFNMTTIGFCRLDSGLSAGTDASSITRNDSLGGSIGAITPTFYMLSVAVVGAQSTLNRQSFSFMLQVPSNFTSWDANAISVEHVIWWPLVAATSGTSRITMAVYDVATGSVPGTLLSTQSRSQAYPTEDASVQTLSIPSADLAGVSAGDTLIVRLVFDQPVSNDAQLRIAVKAVNVNWNA